MCSDGIWDNWKYADVVEASLHKDFVHPSMADGHAKKATDKLMGASLSSVRSWRETDNARAGMNLKKAKENFGSQADNMTGILCHISF